MSDKKPADIVVALRQLSSACKGLQPMSAYPKWFQDMYNSQPNTAWFSIMEQAADELENMQKLNGRLYKTLYGD